MNNWVRDLWLNQGNGPSWMAFRPDPADAPKCKTCGKPMKHYGYGLTDGKPPEPLYRALCDCAIGQTTVEFVDEVAKFGDTEWDAMIERSKVKR